MEKTKIWISYDLGINGDYQSLYTWLDNHKAEECGDSVAVLKEYAYTGDLKAYVTNDIQNHVQLKKTDRVYLFCANPVLAGFIIGGRKRSPWIGYSVEGNAQSDI